MESGNWEFLEVLEQAYVAVMVWVMGVGDLSVALVVVPVGGMAVAAEVSVHGLFPVVVGVLTKVLCQQEGFLLRNHIEDRILHLSE